MKITKRIHLVKSIDDVNKPMEIPEGFHELHGIDLKPRKFHGTFKKNEKASMLMRALDQGEPHLLNLLTGEIKPLKDVL